MPSMGPEELSEQSPRARGEHGAGFRASGVEGAIPAEHGKVQKPAVNDTDNCE